jgi:hypothetical protein
MPEFIMVFGNTTIDMTKDVKAAKSKKDVAAAVKKAAKAAIKKEKKK